MAVYVDPYVRQLAQQASSACGLNADVILAQWQVEEGVGSPNWPGNNPAGISPGDPRADALSDGRTSGGFLAFPTPASGAQAYAAMYQYDPNYAGVRAAVQTGNPMQELAAIVASPWDAGHYGGGSKLYQAYSAITGQPVNNIASFSAGSGSVSLPATSPAKNAIQFPSSNFSVVANSQRTGDVLYGRRYRCVIQNQAGFPSLDVSDLRFVFDVQYTVNQQPPFSTVVIYNLNPAAEDVILNYGDLIVVEAGYEGTQYGVIFEGEIVEPVRDQADNVTYRLTLNCLQADRVANQAFAAFSVARGQSARAMVGMLAAKASVPSPVGELSPSLSNAALPRGKTVFGLTRDYLRQIAQGDGLALHYTNGNINMLGAADPPHGEVINLTPESGLIGQPTQTGLGVQFTCLLNPALTIGSMVHIDSSIIAAQTFQIGQVPRPLDGAGLYRVMSVEHQGDTRGNQWTTTCTTVSQAGGIPGMMSATTGVPWG